ncbi:ricin B lectin domain-containing protein [Chytridium lagenaria]|nr:ricin B lectin domain-containing protein [Chytridium lagenaria]
MVVLKFILALAVAAASFDFVDAQSSITTPCTMIAKAGYSFLINAYRRYYNLPNLSLDQRLINSAQAHSQDMSRNCGLRHDSCNGMFWGNRLASYVTDWTFLAEMSENQVIAAWQRSPAHNANLLHTRPRYFGSGFSVSSTGRGFWTQDFADTSNDRLRQPVSCSWPASVPQTWYGQLKSKIEANTPTPLCLDASDGRSTTGTRLFRVRACDSRNLNQTISIQPIDNASSFVRLYYFKLDLCVDVLGQSLVNGATVGFWSCTNSQNQHFSLTSSGGFRARHSGKCLELSGTNVHEAGTPVTQFDCNGRDNQIFNR